MRFRDKALADVTVADCEDMLSENETLFVEHKSALREQQFNLAKAAASFSNGLGGWILIGARDGAVVSGQEGEWDPPGEDVFVGQVREALAGALEPPPPFSAALRRLDRGTIGLVRIYESADTPHIVMANGGLYVREVAKDRRLNNAGGDAYEPAAVRSQALLQQLAMRGVRAVAEAERLLAPGTCPWIQRSLGFRSDVFGAGPLRRPGAGAALRLVPLTRLPSTADWAVSQRGLDALARAAANLAHEPDVSLDQCQLDARGLAISRLSREGAEPLARIVHETAAAPGFGAADLSA